VREVLRVVEDDPQLREDAGVIEALREIPVGDLCRAGLDLTAVGVKPALRRASAIRRSQRYVD
jgi:hypothetical protein